MQNDLAGLQGPVPLGGSSFGLRHVAHQGCNGSAQFIMRHADGIDPAMATRKNPFSSRRCIDTWRCDTRCRLPSGRGGKSLPEVVECGSAMKGRSDGDACDE
jgi:hypothetical protein